jgi:hypothetical protein
LEKQCDEKVFGSFVVRAGERSFGDHVNRERVFSDYAEREEVIL